MEVKAKDPGRVDIQEQFKALAKVLVVLERAVALAPSYNMPGVSVRTFDEYCAKEYKLTSLGAEFLACMIAQSDRITLSECRQWYVRKDVVGDN